MLMIGLSAFMAAGCGAKTADDQAHQASGGAAIQGGATASGGAESGGAAIRGGAAASGGAESGGAAIRGGAAASGGAESGGAAIRGGATASGGAESGGAVIQGGAVATGGAPVTGGAALGGSQSMGGSVSTGGASACKPKVCSDLGRCPCGVQLDGCGGEIDCGICEDCCPMDCEMLCGIPEVANCIETSDAGSVASDPCMFGDGCGGALRCNCTE